MIFLPIVDRELRVAARKHSTFWVRVIAAMVGLIIGGGCFVFLSSIPGGGFGPLQAGKILFNLLTWFAIFGVFSAGLFFTSDCVSEEKREGTLGFLFLTDLKGIDVAAGKLLANSLRSFYALLALFPILGLTLLLGGVTGAQFGLTCLALANGLLYSLVAGLAVSTLGLDSQKVLGGTLLVMLCLVFGGPIADSTIAYVRGRSFGPFWTFTSPGYVFLCADGVSTFRFWTSLAITQATVWILFGAVCLLISRTWQVRGRRTPAETKTWTYALKYGSAKSRLAFRRKLFARNPVLWLASRERWQAIGMWFIAAILIGLSAWAVELLPRNTVIGWSYTAKLIMLVLYLWTASQACRFFAEARRTGLVELLLVSPLSEHRIVQGQWRSLMKTFGIPLLLIVVVDTVGTYFSQSVWRQMAAQGGTRLPVQAVAIAGLAASVITALGNIIALCWYGMWMGMTSRSANLATLKTIVFAQVVPWFVVSFASAMALPLLMFPFKGKVAANPSWMMWWPYVMIFVAGALYLAKNIGFIWWARKRLYYSFREEAARSYRTLAVAPPPRLAPTNAPPIIVAVPN